MAKRFTDTEKYKKAFVRSLPGPYKLLWDYLYHDCDHAGVWHKDFDVAQIRIGKDMQIAEEEALRLFNEGEERVRILRGGEKWFVIPFIEFQYGVLNPQNRLHGSVLSVLKRHGIENLVKALGSPFQGASKGAKDKDKDKEQVEVKDGGVGEGPTPDDLMNLWNQEAPAGLPRVTVMSPGRRIAATARLREHPEVEFWDGVIGKIKASKLLRGEVSRNGDGAWKCTLDWILKPNNLAKIVDGNYDDARR